MRSVNWVAVEGDDNDLSGKVNGEPCTITPDTGAEITLVPGHMVYESQLVDEFETIRGVTGEPTLVQCARVPVEFEGQSFEKLVAVANGHMISDKVLFAVPLDKGKARDLLLGAVPESKPSGTGHSDDTSDAQTSGNPGATESKASAGGGGGVEKAPNHQSSDISGVKDVNVVARAGAAMEAARKDNDVRKGERGAKPVAPESIIDIPLLQEVSNENCEEKESSESSSMDDNLGCPELKDVSDVEELRREVEMDSSLKAL